MATKILNCGVMVVEDDTHYAKWIEQHGTLEIATGFIDEFSQYIENGGCVIDVGACMGDHTATYSKLVGPTGTVLALECGGESFACLSYNMEKYPNVVPIKVAAGPYCGRAKFVRNQNIGASYLSKYEDGSVQVVELDGLKKLLGLKPSLIKIDAEGWEHFILLGMEHIMTFDSPAIVLEINQGALAQQGVRKEDIFSLLSQYGYVYKILGSNKIDDPQYDILAVHA